MAEDGRVRPPPRVPDEAAPLGRRARGLTMVTPLTLINRITRPARLTPPIGHCMVCGEALRPTDAMLTLRGGIPVHRACATYRIRQRARTH